jgi:hypothetical protein
MPSRRYWNKDDIVRAIRSWVALYGEAPRVKDWGVHRDEAYPAAATVKEKFGTWAKAMHSAGVQPHPRGRRGQRTFDPDFPTFAG